MSVPNSPLTFPVLDDELAVPWQWPEPPFDWRHVAPPDLGSPQACRIDAARGVSVDGTMLGFDAGASSLRFESPTTGKPGTLFFKRFRRLTLTVPLVPSSHAAGAPLEAVPAAQQERDYQIGSDDGEPELTGRTLGHIETEEGLFLFTAVEGERSVLRVFIPRCAYSSRSFGRSAQEIASERWIASPVELLRAIEHQRSMPVHRIGQSLVDLGLVTPNQIERALGQSESDVPLGERLVAMGIITRADLQTALAHKMGYPLVDLAKFPIDPAVSALLPRDLALRYKALPLMSDQNRLIVAVDRPQRLVKLQALSKFSKYKLVAALASKHQIMLALALQMQRDPWLHTVAARPGFFATTV
ncbi:MAG: hypothetical protein ABIO45_09230 [Burkholderiaceae bacterium]